MASVFELVDQAEALLAEAADALEPGALDMVGHDDTGDITHISSVSRTLPARLRRWVEEAFPCRGVEGCTDDWRLEIDHIVGVEDGGRTEKDNLWRLCRHHHNSRPSTATGSSAGDSSPRTTPIPRVTRRERVPRCRIRPALESAPRRCTTSRGSRPH